MSLHPTVMTGYTHDALADRLNLAIAAFAGRGRSREPRTVRRSPAVTWDPLSLSTIQLLARGHNLYGADYFDAGVADAPAQLRRRLQQLASVNSAEGIGAAALANPRMVAGLGHNAAAEGELDGVLADARTDHSVGWRGTRRVLDDARGDSMPATDTALGRREALHRMAVRLRQQRHYLHRSHQNSDLLARRLRRLTYLRRRHTSAGPHRRQARFH